MFFVHDELTKMITLLMIKLVKADQSSDATLTDLKLEAT